LPTECVKEPNYLSTPINIEPKLPIGIQNKEALALDSCF